MGDTVSIPNQDEQHRKPSPPPKEIPHKGDPLEAPDPPKLSSPPSASKSASTIKKSKTKRCPQCRKENRKRKLTLANSFPCTRCETDYCSAHIGSHDCDFDHHEHQKQLIKEKNPVINFKKIDKI